MHYQIRKKSIKKKRSKSSKNYVNKLIRKNCCWNCFQLDHLRFQCPYFKSLKCSFCRKPDVRSSECNCSESRRHFHVPEHNDEVPANYLNEEVRVTEYGSFSQKVLVPLNNDGETPSYVLNENIVVFIENESCNDKEKQDEEEEDKDILEIHAEDCLLDDI